MCIQTCLLAPHTAAVLSADLTLSVELLWFPVAASCSLLWPPMVHSTDGQLLPVNCCQQQMPDVPIGWSTLHAPRGKFLNQLIQCVASWLT